MKKIIFLLAFTVSFSQSSPQIDHVVLLLMENQPFDKFFGFMQEELPGIEGLTGNECFDDGSGTKTCVQQTAKYVCDGGGSMGYNEMVNEIFGMNNWDGKAGTIPPAEQPQDGWMEVTNNVEVVAQFKPDANPIKSALAKQFGIFNKWHSSFPGPSTPNHLFIMTATSGGCTTTGEDYQCETGKTFPQKTVFENLEANNNTWAYYYNDTTWNYFLEYFNTPAGVAGVQGYDEFYDRAAKGTLPNFSFILPRQGENQTTGMGPNDDHPCHDIALGELLIKDTYEAVRAGPKWNNTLLLITYDDTGGWYDHHRVPTGVPAPDDVKACGAADTDFTWLGLRTPTLLVSPWISKGKVIQEPDGPYKDSEYEHSSISATLKSLFDLPNFLTKRDAWAGDFSKELDLNEPTNQGPMHLPEPPAPATGELATHGKVSYDELTRRQRRRVQGISRACGVDPPDNWELFTHAEAEKYIAKWERIHRDNSRTRRIEEF